MLPHERTLAAPREDRYRLLRATGVNTSPVVVLYRDPSGAAAADLAAVAATSPLTEVTDDDGVHTGCGTSSTEATTAAVARLAAMAKRGPVYIADGHHRYETALRYRDERRMTRSCEPDPPFDFILALLLDADEPLTVLPTHRVVRGLGEDGLTRLRAGLDGLFEVSPTTPEDLVDRFDAAGGLAGGDGRFGLVTRDLAWLLTARRHAFERLLPAAEGAVRRLDVTLLGATLEALAGIDAAAVAGGERIRYTKSAAEAVSWSRPAPTVPTPRSSSSRRPSARSSTSPPRATSCPRNRPTSIPRPSPGSCSTRTSGGPTAGPMTDPTSSDRLRDRTVTSNGRPVRKDEIELVDRGLYIESWLPERRSRRKPILFVHGELGGSWVWERYLHHFAGRGWEGHALNLRNHFWSATADPATLDVGTYTEDVIAAMERLGPTVVVVGHGLGGLLALKALERVPASAYVLIAPELPRDLRDPARPHVVRDVQDAYGRAELGWETLPEKLTREHRDLTLGDVLRIQHMLGQKPFESGRARRQVLQGVPVDRSALPDVPRLVIAAGLDAYVPEADVERLADWLDAVYEPFGAHSHYGLVLGEQSYLQVAETLRMFLETNRL